MPNFTNMMIISKEVVAAKFQARKKNVLQLRGFDIINIVDLPSTINGK